MKAFGVDLVNIFGSGGTRREPAAARGYFHPADGRVVAGRFRQYLVDRLAGKLGDADLLPTQLAKLCLLRRRGGRIDAIGKRGAEFLRQRLVVRAGISPGMGGDFRRQQRRDDTVLVGGPHAAVDSAERRTGAFLAAETYFTVYEPGHEPFEADRHLVDAALEPAADPVDHRAADHRLAHGGIRTPAAAMVEQIVDGGG